MTLFLQPATQRIEIRTQGAAAFLHSVPAGEATLVMADPPWIYSQRPGVANPDRQYDTLSTRDIAGHLRGTYRLAQRGARLGLWATFPILMEALQSRCFNPFAQDAITWKPVSGGSWHKHNARGELNWGVGWHWRGAAELLLMYRRPGKAIRDNSVRLFNAHESQITRHSEKPVDWLEQLLLRWTKPDDLVLDLYAGLAPLARACARTGRRYLGCEIDPQRAAEARELLAAEMASLTPAPTQSAA